MKKLFDKKNIEDIAMELDTEPSFIEKDFYAVKILKELANIDYNRVKLIFTGGTCLSKGYNLIKRFSEDIDFRIVATPELTRGQRKEFREFIINRIKAISDVKYLPDTLKKRNESSFFSFYVEYPREFVVDSSLREALKLEFIFESVLMPTNLCKIETLVGEYIEGLDGTEIECISPIEIAADKFSALMWRIDIKDRTQAKGTTANDATIIRHLHDLASLEKLLVKADFKQCLEQSCANDKGRGGSDRDINLIEFAQKTLEKLKTDQLYEAEYKDFVGALSYAKGDEAIDFLTAINAFERIVSLLK